MSDRKAALQSARATARLALLILPVASVACRPSPAPVRSAAMVRLAGPERTERPERPAQSARSAPVRAAGPCAAAELWTEGQPTRRVCLEEAARAGLTALDLSDDWAPILFSEDEALGPRGRQAYRERLVALANERFGQGPEWETVRDDRYLELYGISPSFSVLRRRLGEEERHRCHAAVEDEPLRALAARKGRGAIPAAAVRAAQRHLRCDGLLSRFQPGRLDEQTKDALRRYQRRHAIVSEQPFDAETRRALLTDSRELDFLAVLRALRERVADATGLIEDGSAAGRPGEVLGRVLDRAPAGAREALEGGAPDLLSPATEAAARALGWTGPQEFLASPQAARALLRLPPPPAYHGPQMELRAVVDRGDVWYDYPFDRRGGRAKQPVERRPTLVLYARQGDREVPLVQWPTTIGGWQVERLPSGYLAYRYKDSGSGPRVFRDLVAAPAWLAPPGIPERELVRRGAGGWQPRSEVIGPGYRSAYGLVMMILHTPLGGAEGAPVYADSTLRVHGSANYTSIVQGVSHGCHRLYNHLALRLGGFLLRHRSHVRHGDLPTSYQRRMYWRDRTISLGVTSRGYRYELTPPVPVEVLPGRVRGAAQAPITRPCPVPRSVVAQYRRW